MSEIKKGLGFEIDRYKTKWFTPFTLSDHDYKRRPNNFAVDPESHEFTARSRNIKLPEITLELFLFSFFCAGVGAALNHGVVETLKENECLSISSWNS